MTRIKRKNYIDPKEDWGEIFAYVQRNGLFKDSKKMADAIAKYDASIIRNKYSVQKRQEGFEILKFIDQNFEFFQYQENQDDTKDIEVHINSLWKKLSRSPDKLENSSKIPLPFEYIVPGGRFNEIYYWDSYFTMLGLREAGNWTMIKNMIDNFQWMINNLGFIPNGNRSYFLGRSQPPFFTLMIDLLKSYDVDLASKYIPSIEQEYNYWSDNSSINTNYTVSLGDYRLTRYDDRVNEPRDESYIEDIELYEQSNNNSLYKHLRAACESGWDFSSRWMDDPFDLGTIKTNEIIPIDLNCLLYFYEYFLSNWFENKDEVKFAKYQQLAKNRKSAIDKLFYDEKEGFYFDIDFNGKIRKERMTLAGVFPLFFNIVEENRISAIVENIEKYFLKSGGLVTSIIGSGQQWDAPNGWAPLQYMSVIGLINYGHNNLATEIMDRWCLLNESVFGNTGKMMEKYNVEDISTLAGGGEYPNQDGFGWTNGVYSVFKKMIKTK